MTASRADLLTRHLCRLAAGREAALPDRELLRSFLEQKDEAAFAALVARHGATVLDVCRAVLRDGPDAEDAFQATFLVLARRASSVRRPESLAGWLHGVAYRLAKKAQVAGARRRAVEARAPAADSVAAADALPWGEVREALHAELARLPERLRAPLVLCYLEGLTRDEAARRLGVRPSTVKGRLQQSRERLRRRLGRRGFGPAAVLGAAVLGGRATGKVPPALAAAATRAALRTDGSGAAALARGWLGPLVPAKLRAVGGVLLLAGALLGSAVLVSPGPKEEALPAAPAGTVDARPEPAADAWGDPLPEGAVARLGTVRFNHGDRLNAVLFTPDGKTLVSQGGGIVRRWDAATGKELGHFAVAKPWFDEQVALTPDGKSLVVFSQDNNDTLRVWDLATGREARRAELPVERRISGVDWRNTLAPDTRRCATLTPAAVQVFDAATARELWALPAAGREFRAVTFAGNDRVVTADKKRTIEVSEAATGKPIRRFAHGGPVEEITASPDGRRLATLEHHTHAIDRLLERDVVRVWDLSTGAELLQLAARPKRWFMHVRFSPDGKLLFASAYGTDGGEVSVWDVGNGRRIRELNGLAGYPFAVSPDGSRVVLGVPPGKFELWDVQAGRQLSPGDGAHTLAATVFLSPTGDRAFTIGYKSISVWDGATGRRLRSSDVPHFGMSDPKQTHSPDGHYALTFEGGWEEARALVWDVAAGRELYTLGRPFQPNGFSSAFSPDSSLLATRHAAKETAVYVWDVRTGREVRSFPEAKAERPGHLFFAGDGKTLIVAGRRVVGYEVATGRELFSWRVAPAPVKSDMGMAVGGVPVNEEDRFPWRTLTVSSDGSVVAYILREGFSRNALPDRIVLCDARTGKVFRRWSDSDKPSNMYEQLAFSPDGRLLASSDGATVHLWEVATGKEVRTFRGHRGEIDALGFSANGRRLASASADSTVLLWALEPAATAGAASEKEVAAWWADLAAADARRAYDAAWRLAESPGPAVALFRRHLRPVTDADLRELRRLAGDLDSETFAVRQQALKGLGAAGPTAVPVLRDALAKGPSAEVRRQAERLLGKLGDTPGAGESLRALRAVAVLERAGTPEARRLLGELAGGVPEVWLTREARESLERLARRPAAAP
jgi:RNA polymerase sigma factor (sigma-70 family)